MKLNNFKRFDPAYTSEGRVGLSRGNSGEEQVWNALHSDPKRCAEIARAIVASLDDPEVDSAWIDSGIDDGAEEAEEGRILTRKHVVRERDKKLVRRKVRRVMKQSGKLACEVCNIDFAVVYGNRGIGFIECHHTRPISTPNSKSTTRLEDLAVVCSNCHRMIHRTRPWLSLDELRMALKTKGRDTGMIE